MKKKLKNKVNPTKSILMPIPIKGINQRELNNSAEYIEEEVDTFSYSVSHDLKAPLVRINSYGNILKETYSPKLDQDGKKIVNSILSDVKRMNELIENLYTFSKSGNKVIHMSDIHMNALVKSVVDELSSSIPTNIQVEITIKNILPALGDHILIRQVLFNLISNAVKFSSKKEKPTIEIGSYSSGNMNVYYTKDNGVGFDMRYSNKLFKVFQRLHSEEDFEGTGAGLAIAKRVINKHGGDVWGESIKGKGATFYFTLKAIQ